MLARLKQLLFGRWHRRRRPKMQPLKLVNEQALQEMFLHAPENPLWQATLAVLDQQVQEMVDDAMEEKLTNDQLRYRLGGAAGILRLKSVLQDYEVQARQVHREEEEQRDKRNE